MTVLGFRIGDVFDPEDDVSLWFVTIALAHNDLVLTYVRREAANREPFGNLSA